MSSPNASRSNSCPPTFGYTTPSIRIAMPIFFGVMCIVAVDFMVFVLASSDEEFVARGGEPNRALVAAFMILWMAVLGFAAFEMLWQDGTKVVVTRDELTWSSVLRSRVVPLSVNRHVIPWSNRHGFPWFGLRLVV